LGVRAGSSIFNATVFFIRFFLDLHNETGTAVQKPCALCIDVPILVNIHTHLHASILFVFLLFTANDSYFKAREGVSWADRVVFMVFLFSAIFCLFCSAFFHMASSHSEQVSVLSPTAMN
jgi:uncharacterized PurR-regulated membrane protein YhhQ (DUF165 family)